MDAKTYLNQVIKLENKLYSKKEQLIILEQKMIYSSPAGNDSIGSGASAQFVVDKLPMQIANKEILENDIKTIEKDLIVKKAEILKTIDKLDDELISEILYMRYLRKMPINKIAERIDKPIKWVYHNHTEGINAIQIMLYAQQPRVSIKYHLYDLLESKIIFTGKFTEIANFLNTDVHRVTASCYQKLTIGHYCITTTNNVDEQVSIIKKKKGNIQ